MFIMAGDWSFKVEILTSERYHSWKFKMKMYLISKGLWEIVTGAETVSNETLKKRPLRNVKTKLLQQFL